MKDKFQFWYCGLWWPLVGLSWCIMEKTSGNLYNAILKKKIAGTWKSDVYTTRVVLVEAKRSPKASSTIPSWQSSSAVRRTQVIPIKHPFLSHFANADCTILLVLVPFSLSLPLPIFQSFSSTSLPLENRFPSGISFPENNSKILDIM